ncbi:glycosyltransferase family 4 protein [Jatrophihabitans sp. YIM 134969]
MARVLLDATAIPADRGGVGRYVDGLVAAFAAGAAPDVDLVVVHAPGDDVLAAAPVESVAAPAATARTAARFAWEQTGLPRLARRLRADVLHSPHYTLPLAAPCPVVVTLHDATFFSGPQWHSRVKGPFFRSWTRIAARRAAGLVVPSAATRDDVAAHVRLDATRVTVAPHGVDHDLFRPPSGTEVDALRARLGVDGEFVGFLGTLEPRKNVPALVEGWVRACRDRATPPALVLAGGAGWDPGIDAAVDAVPSSLQLVRPGYLELDQLPALLGGAAVTAYPSLGEGFGLPVLEAMASGGAVLTTRKLSLPEVGGDAVAYCETGPDAIAAGLSELLDTDTTALREHAVARAAGFTWARCAALHADAYRAAAA